MLFGEVKSRESQFSFSGRFSEFLIHLHEQSPQALWSTGLTRIQGWIHWGFQLKQNAPRMEDAESTIRETWQLEVGTFLWVCRGGTRGILCCQDFLFSPNQCMLNYGHSKGDATNQKGTSQLLLSLGGSSVGGRLRVLVEWHTGNCCAGREEVTVLHCFLLCLVGSCWSMVRWVEGGGGAKGAGRQAGCSREHTWDIAYISEVKYMKPHKHLKCFKEPGVLLRCFLPMLEHTAQWWDWPSPPDKPFPAGSPSHLS